MLRPPETITDTKSLFRQAEIRAELLVGYLRLIISSTLGAAFILAMVMNPDPMDPVIQRQSMYAVATMGLYFALGLVCIIAIRKERFQHWMVWPAAMADCGFILFNLWLSMANTGLTGEYMVVMPPMWLIPVVLACGVLRFNPGLQLLIIVVLVTGLVMLDAAFRGQVTGDVAATLDFFFAGPPTMMRFVMIALSGVVLVVATVRTRSLFLRTLTETERRVNLTRYVPAEVASELARTGLEARQAGERRDMGVLFVDMRGFTARAETMTPEDLTEFVTRYRRYVTEAARAHGGIIDKFIGDAVMVVFGADPGKERETAQDAIACAQSILEVIDQWAEDELEAIRVGIGLHWGEVFVGVIGDEDRLEYSVFGDTVNIAARLEELTKSLHVPMIASDALLKVAASDPSLWRDLPPTQLRGRSGALSIFGWAPDLLT